MVRQVWRLIFIDVRDYLFRKGDKVIECGRNGDYSVWSDARKRVYNSSDSLQRSNRSGTGISLSDTTSMAALYYFWVRIEEGDETGKLNGEIR